MTRRWLHLTIALIAIAAILPATALAKGATRHSADVGCHSLSAVCVYHEGGTGTHKAVPLSSKAARELAKLGGKDRALLEYLATREGVEPVPGASVGNVSSLGGFLAALDLGAGPIALFATLLAGAAAFGVGRALRRRRSAARV